MEKDYSHYTAENLLKDDYFLMSEKRPSDETIRFWELQAQNTPALEKEIKLARNILKGIRVYEDLYPIPQYRIDRLKLKIDQQNQLRNSVSLKRKVIYITTPIAAAIALLILFLLPGSPVPEEPDYTQIALQFEKQISEDSKQIRLVIGDEKELILEGKEAEIDYSKQEQLRINGEQMDLADEGEETSRFNHLFVPKGKRTFLTLSDGTKIWVNSDSRVIYADKFSATKREIYVEGEIYLDVTHDPSRPFIVKTSEMEVTVLGTQFDISAYKHEEEQYVVLVDGKVEVTAPGKEKTIIHPHQKLSMNENNIQISQVDVNDFIGWKDGYFQFKERQLNTVFQKLSQFYGVDFSYNEKIKELTCSGKLNLSDQIEEVMTILQKVAPIQVIYQDTNKIHIEVKP